jgi:hypothetical protein
MDPWREERQEASPVASFIRAVVSQ